jgi:transcriptional regulator with XRE-family HTH domain
MNRIKQLRQSRNLTQATLAEIIGTTQQTIQRWETGKTDISASALKDLAMILNYPIDEILGITEISRNLYSRAFANQSSEKKNQLIVSHYGGVELKIVGVADVSDYPIDEEAARLINRLLLPIDDPHEELSSFFPWMYCETLNNYIVFSNLKALKFVHLYTDDCHQSPTYYNSEIYRTLTDCEFITSQDSSSDLVKSLECSEKFANVIKDVINKYEEQEKDWDSWHYFHYAKVYWLDGDITHHYIDETFYRMLSNLQDACEDRYFYPNAHLKIRFIQEEDEEGYTNFLNLDHIGLIEVPAIKYWQVAQEYAPEIYSDSDASLYVKSANGKEKENGSEQEL